MVEPTQSKNMLVKLDHFPKFRDENQKIVETTIWATKKNPCDIPLNPGWLIGIYIYSIYIYILADKNFQITGGNVIPYITQLQPGFAQSLLTWAVPFLMEPEGLKITRYTTSWRVESGKFPWSLRCLGTPGFHVSHEGKTWDMFHWILVVFDRDPCN